MDPHQPKLDELLAEARRDGAMATSDGRTLTPLPDGALMRDLPVHPDDRGQVTELFDPRWNWHPEPFYFSYFFTIKPHSAKGWAVHLEHEDRYTIVRGEMQVILYDSRPEASTFGRVFRLFLSEKRPRALSIPVGVWHADYNASDAECLVVNFPTVMYNHAAPDKYRLPLRTPLIPFQFPPDVNGY